MIKSSEKADELMTDFKRELNFESDTKFDKGFLVLKKIKEVKSKLKNKDLIIYRYLKVIDNKVEYDIDDELLKRAILNGLEYDLENTYKESHNIGGNVSLRVDKITMELFLFELRGMWNSLGVSEADVKRYVLLIKDNPNIEDTNEIVLKKFSEKFTFLYELGIIDKLNESFPDATYKVVGNLLKEITGEGAPDTWRKLYSDYLTGEERAKGYPLKEKNIEKAKALFNKIVHGN